MAGRGIRVEVDTGDIGVSPEKQFVAVADAIMFDRLQEALLRIKRLWPIDTGRSFAAWALIRTAAMRYSILNQARTRFGEYAGWVHRKGSTAILADTMVVDEIDQAIIDIRTDFLTFRRTGVAPALPSLQQTIIDQLRGAIAETLLQRVLKRTRGAA